MESFFSFIRWERIFNEILRGEKYHYIREFKRDLPADLKKDSFFIPEFSDVNGYRMNFKILQEIRFMILSNQKVTEKKMEQTFLLSGLVLFSNLFMGNRIVRNVYRILYNSVLLSPIIWRY